MGTGVGEHSSGTRLCVERFFSSACWSSESCAHSDIRCLRQTELRGCARHLTGFGFLHFPATGLRCEANLAVALQSRFPSNSKSSRSELPVLVGTNTHNGDDDDDDDDDDDADDDDASGGGREEFNYFISEPLNKIIYDVRHNLKDLHVPLEEKHTGNALQCRQESGIIFKEVHVPSL